MNMENNKISTKILILDDEPLLADYLKMILKEQLCKNEFYTGYSVDSFNDYDGFIEVVKKDLPAIIFLDIEMPGMNGIDIAKNIKENASEYGYNDIFPIIIFSTAYDQYGYDAFQSGASHYILKPFGDELISDTLNLLIKRYGQKLIEIGESVSVTYNGISMQVPLKEVVYFKADTKYVIVKTEKKEFIIVDTIANLEQKYENFLRVHRSTLVNPLYVKRFFKNKDGNWQLLLKNSNETIPVSRRQRQKSEIFDKISYYDVIN